MKLVKSSFQIIAGRISYVNDKFEKQFAEMKDKHEGEWGEAVFEIIDRVQHFQFKYLHGYLLPDIAFAMGETDTEYIKQFILKVNFLYREIDDWKKIPNKHRSNCRIVTRIEDGVEVVKGYIPSTSVLTYDEMAKFLKDCENFLIAELSGHLGMSEADPNKFQDRQREALEVRELANLAIEVEQTQQEFF